MDGMKKTAALSLLLLVWAFASASGGAAQEKPQAFGYDIFRAPSEPIVEGPVDDGYLLSPGDEVVISVWGQLNLKHALVVSDDGFIDIPEEGGRVFTSGASLKELRRMVTESLSRVYASYINAENPGQSTAFVDVKLGKIRKLLVYVVGEVKNQGPYTISSGVATLINVLINAGGVKETGSLRDVRIRRADGIVDAVDLYDFLLAGKANPKMMRLRYGDYVIVPVKGKSVTARGEVKRPGIYELAGSEGIKALMGLAGGLNPNAYLKRVQIKRFTINEGERVIDLDLEPMLADAKADFAMADGDDVSFFPNIQVRRPVVEILGEGIKRPGTYEHRPGMTLKDLVQQAEGLREDIFLERADLVRTEDDFSKKLTKFALKDLYKEAKPGVYEFAGDEAAGKNFVLKELDQIRTYSAFDIKGKDKYVTLEGQVKEPGTYVLAEGMGLYDLIFARGGFQDDDFKKRTYLELGHVFRKASGELEEQVLTFNLGKLLGGDPVEDIKLGASDRVVIYSYESLEKKPFVTIQGLVIRPGMYPLAGNMTLEDLILIAGGLRPDAFKVEAVIARTKRAAAEAGAKREISTIIVPVALDYAVLPKEKKTPLEISDQIAVRNLPEWEPLPVVGLTGYVRFPGVYSFESREERVSNIVQRAGGLKDGAFPEGARLLRRKFILNMARERGGELETVAIDLKAALDAPGGPSDLFLKDGDLIFVPPDPGTVEVRGAVRNPAIFQCKKGKSAGYYIGLAGGYARDADKGSVVVLQPNGFAQKRKGGLLAGSGASVLAGSVVDVPYKGEASEVEIVEVRGAVKRPRIVAWRMGEKLEHYIELAGGYNEGADSAKVVVYLEDGKMLETKKGDAGELAGTIIAAGSVIEVPVKEKPEAVALAAGAQIVEVKGAVKRPRIIAWRQGEKLDYYIRLAGGYDEDANSNMVVVHLEDGNVLEAKGPGGLLAAVIPVGSVIEVPAK
jgi:polysaccharide export outer membrane protein